MIDKWFSQDLDIILETYPVAVFIDESRESDFLLKTVNDQFTILHANTELDELHLKYTIEKSQPGSEKFLIYTSTKRDELKFIREYCETCGCLEIRYLQNYIKDKVHQVLNLNINLAREELVAAAKVSVGKDRGYWMDLCHKGATEIFDLKKELLPFLNDPEAYATEKYDAQLRDTFYRKVNELLGQEYLSKPASTLAEEVVKAMLDGLAAGFCDKTLESVYTDWLDSISYRESFRCYIDNYIINPDLDIWNVCINHPFRQIDDKWLAEIGSRIADKSYITATLAILRQRDQNKQAKTLGFSFWSDVITLLDFDSEDIAYLSSFHECVEFYTKHFFKLDTAIRNLYTEYLNKKNLLEPFQELYKELVSIFLDKWFKYWSEYRENQTGTLQRIIDETDDFKVAIIVGDGVAYEIAEMVAFSVKGAILLEKDSILADIPSETENNMSRIYMNNGVTEAIHGKREKYLVEKNPGVDFDFIQLDVVTGEPFPGQFLICTYKDIDDMGEKLQQKALKYFPETINFFAEKVSLLLASGYRKVYLITDHGFVLTGLLSDADKISNMPDVIGKAKERYYVSSKEYSSNEWIVRERDAEYFFFAKSMNSFRSTGAYGYAHGGLTPQELITPYFCWEKAQSQGDALQVSIANKYELSNVTGDLFSIKLESGQSTGELFDESRAIVMVFFANKVQINKSDVFTIDKEQTIKKEYTFDGNKEIEVQLLDASSKQVLDKAEIKQNNDRDLGGLL